MDNILHEVEDVDFMTVGTINLGACTIDDKNIVIGSPNFGAGYGECVVKVYPNEGQIPHFHIESKDGKFKCCPCIFEPLYFNHGTKTGKLSSQQRKILNNWLSNPTNKILPTTNWQNIISYWQALGNPLTNFPTKPVNQPDYTKLENMRG